MSNVAKIMESTELTKLIGTIGKKSVALTGLIQTAAVECIAQSIVHRNATPAQQLYEAVGTTVRRDSLVKYFELWGNLAWSKQEKRVMFFDVEKIIGTKMVWDAEYAAKVTSNHWTAAKKEAAPVSKYDVSEEIDKLLERLHKLQKKGATIAHADLLLRIEQAYNAYQFEEFQRATKVSEEDEANATKAAEQEAQQTGEVGTFPTEPVLERVAA